jgi:probable addiction module antidote protein
VYFGQRGQVLVILPAGGDKPTPDQDIKTARELAQELEEIIMAKTKTRSWDGAEHLETDEDMAAYLEAALEEGEAALVAAALGDMARAKGMALIARETGLGRESLYKALSSEGNPEFATVLKVVRALGLRLRLSTAQA